MDYDKLEQTCLDVLRVGWTGINPREVLEVIRVARDLPAALDRAVIRAEAAEAQRDHCYEVDTSKTREINILTKENKALAAEIAELREAVRRADAAAEGEKARLSMTHHGEIDVIKDWLSSREGAGAVCAHATLLYLEDMERKVAELRHGMAAMNQELGGLLSLIHI